MDGKIGRFFGFATQLYACILRLPLREPGLYEAPGPTHSRDAASGDKDEPQMAKTFLIALALLSAALAPTVSAAQPNAQSFVNDIQTGIASYYARKFEGRRTANGDTFRHDSLTAAHPSLPFGTVVRVTSIDRERSVIVRITDRLPSKRAVIDLTQKAAAQLDMLSAGRTRVSIQVLEWGKGGARALRHAAQQTPVVLSAATELLTPSAYSADESR